MRIVKRVEFDAGHRIPNHNSKCKNLHGHRYILEAALDGEVRPARGYSDDGMVIDFSDIKRVMTEHVHDEFDHAFLVWDQDRPVLDALDRLAALEGGHRTVVLPVVPTAENLARLIFDRLSDEFTRIYGDELTLTYTRLYETPNGWAECWKET